MGDGTLKVLVELQSQVELFNFLSLINEIDLYPIWVPFCKKSELVGLHVTSDKRSQRFGQVGSDSVQLGTVVVRQRVVHNSTRLGSAAVPRRDHD